MFIYQGTLKKNAAYKIQTKKNYVNHVINIIVEHQKNKSLL